MIDNLILYTIATFDNNKHILLGSSFQSNVALFLYYSNKVKYNNVYLIKTEFEEDYFDYSYFLELESDNIPLHFYASFNGTQIQKLSFEGKNNIFKLESYYYTEKSLSENSLYQHTLDMFEFEKKYILNNEYIEQDKVISDFEDKSFNSLFVGVIHCYKNGNENIILTNCCHNKEMVAALLNEHLKNIDCDCSYFYFKEFFIHRYDLPDYLINNKISFGSFKDNGVEKIDLIPLIKNDNQEIQFNSIYQSTFSENNKEIIENVSDDLWKQYKSFFENQIVIENKIDLEEEIERIKELNNLTKNDWYESFEILKQIFNKDMFSINIYDSLEGYESFDNKNKEEIFDYINDTLQYGKNNNNIPFFVILFNQKSKLNIVGKNKKLTSSVMILYKDCVELLSKSEGLETLKELNIELNSFIIDSRKVFNV